MTRKFIGQMMEEMRAASADQSPNTVEDTKQDICEVAAKQILRKMRVEGFASPYQYERNKRITANRILPEAKDGNKQAKKCPPGYKYDTSQMMCVPIKSKDSVGTRSDKDSSPRNGPGYNVWGNSGYSGAGYAWESEPTTNDLSDGGGDGGGGMSEEKDACYHKVKSKYNVWPSAYASGALVQCRKKGSKNWGNKAKDVKEQEDRIEGKRKNPSRRTVAPHLNGYDKAEAIAEEMNWNSLSERKRHAAQELIMDGVRRKNRIAEENLMQFRTKEQHDESVLLNNTTMNDIAW